MCTVGRAFVRRLMFDGIVFRPIRCCRDASGMTLEMEAIETSLVKLAPSGWTPSVAYDKEADEVCRWNGRLVI